MKEDKLAKALGIIKIKGPVIPSQINKDLDVDVLMGSAILSELVDKGQLRLTSLKVGSSPLYYAPGQESMLLRFTEHLNPKDRETMELLKQRKVLKDKDLEPIQRVSLRQIKDFAKPLNVTVGNESAIFWKWYLISNEEAAELIKPLLPKPVQQERPAEKPRPQEPLKPEVNKEPENIPENKPEAIKEEPRHIHKEHKPEEKKEVRENVKEMQQKLGKDAQERQVQQEASETPELPNDKFFRKIKKYFDDNSIRIVDYKIIRKESDIDFTVKILSSVGSLTYFCKAKNKKKFNDGDISSVFIEGQRKKMPVLFLITGELTKKAKDVLESEFKNMYVKRI